MQVQIMIGSNSKTKIFLVEKGREGFSSTCRILIGTNLNKIAMKWRATELNYRHG